MMSWELGGGADGSECTSVMTGVRACAAAPDQPPRAPDVTMRGGQWQLGSTADIAYALSELPRIDLASDLQIKGVIGQGGMGVVSLARERVLNREVAVKRVRPEMADKPHAIASLIAEAKVQGALEHPNVVPLHALGQDEAGLPTLVMKRLSGVSWRALMFDPDHPAWPAGVRDQLVFHLETLMQIANAVHFAHSRGVIHRDIKPDNVMIGSFGEVYLLDWGLACSTAADGIVDANIVGTPSYMAPEMLLGSGPHITPRTDVYLLGAALHEVLTGTLRHVGESVDEVLVDVAFSAPVEYPPSVPDELAALCNRATRQAPEERPATALEFREAIADYLRHRGSIALAESAAERLAELRAACDGAGEGELASHRVHMLFSEARFGFREALKTWDGNERARAGLDEALECMIGFEIAQHNAEAAAALTLELSAPRPDLEEAIAALRTRRRREEVEIAYLRGLAHELDPVVSAGPRSVAVVLVAAVVGAVMYVLGSLRASNIEVSLTILSLGLPFAAMFFLRGDLLANYKNRQLWLMWVIMGVGFAVNHAVAALRDGADAVSMFGVDLIVAAVVAAGLAAQLEWQLLVAPATFTAGAALIAVWPERAPAITAGASVLGAFLGALLDYRNALRATGARLR